jgi:hypothetical protein
VPREVFSQLCEIGSVFERCSVILVAVRDNQRECVMKISQPSSCDWPLIKGTSSGAGCYKLQQFPVPASSTSSSVQQQGGRYIRSTASIHRLNQRSHSVGKCAVITQHIAGDIAGVSSRTAGASHQVAGRFEVLPIAGVGMRYCGLFGVL